MSTTQSEADFDVISAVMGPSSPDISFELMKGFDVAPRTPSLYWNGGTGPELSSDIIFKVADSAAMANPFSKVSYNFNGGVVAESISPHFIDRTEMFHILGPYTILPGRVFHPRDIK